MQQNAKISINQVFTMLQDEYNHLTGLNARVCQCIRCGGGALQQVGITDGEILSLGMLQINCRCFGMCFVMRFQTLNKGRHVFFIFAVQ